MRLATVKEFLPCLGCLFAIAVFVVLCVLGITTDVRYLLLPGLLLGALVVRIAVIGKEPKSDLAYELEWAFEEFCFPTPELTKGSSYGMPTFTLTFQDRFQMNAAEQAGHISAFKLGLSELYADVGSASDPFQVEWALSVEAKG